MNPHEKYAKKQKVRQKYEPVSGFLFPIKSMLKTESEGKI
jgi:hypothetical protein